MAAIATRQDSTMYSGPLAGAPISPEPAPQEDLPINPFESSKPQDPDMIVEIPLKDTDQVIELNLQDPLPSEEVVNILKAEQVTLNIWIKIAEAYYVLGKSEDFMRVLETARSEANLMYSNHEKDQVICLDKLAAYYVTQTTRVDKEAKARKEEYKQKATQYYTMADKIDMYDTNHLLGRACFCLHDKTKLEQAQQQFKYVLQQENNKADETIKALLGQAAIYFEKGDYYNALGWYRKALRSNPSCQDASIRLGIGICAYKLKKFEKAKQAFKRALVLNPKCTGALIGLAVLQLNCKFSDPENAGSHIKQGTQMLSKAYHTENENPIVLILLADHFFYKKEYQKTRQLAMGAIRNTDMDEVRAEAYYHLARCSHVNQKYDEAFQYYYKSTQLSFDNYQNYVLPHFGLGQLFIYRSKNTQLKEHAQLEYLNKAIECFEKVIEKYPKNYDAIKILATLYAYFSNFKPTTKESKKELKTVGSVGDQSKCYEESIKYFQQALELNKEDSETIIAYASLLERTDISQSLEKYEQVLHLYNTDELYKNLDCPVEILNNVANLYAKKLIYDKAKENFHKAINILDKIDKQHGSESVATAGLKTTIKYNLARYYEQINQQQDAIKIYKQIIKTVPKYIDGHLRLGIIYKQRGYFYEADEMFRDAITMNQKSADSWALLGNLRFAKGVGGFIFQ